MTIQVQQKSILIDGVKIITNNEFEKLLSQISKSIVCNCIHYFSQKSFCHFKDIPNGNLTLSSGELDMNQGAI